MKPLGIALAALAFPAALLAQEEALVIEHFGQRASANRALAAAKSDGTMRVVIGGIAACAPVWADSESLTAELVANAGLDAVAIGYDDLAKEASLGRLVLSSKIPFVCANVSDAKSGAPVAAPFVVRTSGTRRVAFVGVTRVPSYGKAAVSRWTIDDPASTLRTLLTKIAKEADWIVLLAVMDRIECSRLVREVPGIHVAIVASPGTHDSAALLVGSTYLIQTPVGSEVLGRLKLDLDAGKVVGAENRFEPVVLTPQDETRVRQAYANCGDGADPARFLDRTSSVPEGAAGPPTTLEVGRSVALECVRSNRSVRLEIRGMHLLAEFGGSVPPEGAAWLILDTEWTNIVPMTLVFERQMPTTYVIPSMAEALHLIVNERKLVRLETGLSSKPGGLIETAFQLPNLGSSRRGILAFAIPPKDLETLEIRLYDFAHGHVTVPLLARPKEKPAPALQPVVALQTNEVAEVGVFDLRRTSELAGTKAPPGLRFLRLELLARSAFTFSVDATAFDPKAKAGDRIQVGAFVDFPEIRADLQLVVDGEYAYLPTSASSLPDSARFLPDVLTGDALVYLVPEKATSLELRMEFQNVATPGGEVLRPKPILFALEGRRPDLPKRQAIAEIQDGPFRPAVIGMEIAREFSGQKAADGMRFLVLDVSVRNVGESGKVFQTKVQLGYLTEDGGRLSVHPASFAGPHPATELVWIPLEELRTFQVVFEIPETEKRYRLSYAGIVQGDVVELRPPGK